MTKSSRKDLRLLAYPYIFVLKEGQKIQTNPMDFSLLMLQVTSPEVIKSPSDYSLALLPKEGNFYTPFIPKLPRSHLGNQDS